MPTYEYRCKDCGRHLEVVQSFKDDPITECPHCGGVLKKVFGNVGIAFKGTGFYKTDSRSSGKTGTAAPIPHVGCTRSPCPAWISRRLGGGKSGKAPRPHRRNQKGVAVSGRSLTESLVELWRAAKWALCGRVATLPRKIY